MNLRVEIDSICCAVDLDDAAWTPELIATLLRQCGNEAVRIVENIGLPGDRDDDGAVLEALADDDTDDSDCVDGGE